MLPLRHLTRWRVVGVLLLVFVTIMAIVPAVWLWPNLHGAKWLISDKWLHGITFAVLAIWYSGQYARSSYWWLALGLTLFGAFIEVCQAMLTYRTAEWGDLKADVAGIGVGLLIALSGAGGWSLHVENWLKNRFG